MTFNELEKICSLLWGQSWQSELGRHLNIDRRTVNKWRENGVAEWVNEEIPPIVRQRKLDINECLKLLNEDR